VLVIMAGSAFFAVRSFGSVSGALQAAGRAAGRLGGGGQSYTPLRAPGSAPYGSSGFKAANSYQTASPTSSKSKSPLGQPGNAGAVAAGLGKMKISADAAAARLSGASSGSGSGARSPFASGSTKGGYGAV
jgi:hypothetical protein